MSIVYDAPFASRMLLQDGDGNRVKKTVAGVPTLYLVDTQNPTGYAQVLAEEAQNTAPQTSYVYGLERISLRRDVLLNGSLTTQIRYFDYDGHGSVRALTDPSGSVTDTYDYDAFGNLIHSTGTTQNVYLYSGEQFDPDLNLYYNRARYLSVSTGRFWSMDTFEGDDQSPVSLHKYLYAGASAVDAVDPTGNFEDLNSFLVGIGARFTVYALDYPVAFKTLSTAVALLAPVELQAIDPTYDFEAATGLSVAFENVRQLGVIRQAFLRIGGFGKLGTAFEKFMGNIARQAEGYEAEQVRIFNGQRISQSLEGSARIDYLFKQFILEVKLTAQAALSNTNQIIQYAKFSEKVGLPIRYIFLQKPSQEEIQAIKQIAKKGYSGAEVIVDYLFD